MDPHRGSSSCATISEHRRESSPSAIVMDYHPHWSVPSATTAERPHMSQPSDGTKAPMDHPHGPPLMEHHHSPPPWTIVHGRHHGFPYNVTIEHGSSSWAIAADPRHHRPSYSDIFMDHHLGPSLCIIAMGQPRGPSASSSAIVMGRHGGSSMWHPSAFRDASPGGRRHCLARRVPRRGF